MGSPRGSQAGETKWPNVCFRETVQIYGEDEATGPETWKWLLLAPGDRRQSHERGEEAWVGERYRRKNQLVLGYVLAVWGKVREEPRVGVGAGVIYWFGDTDQKQV